MFGQIGKIDKRVAVLLFLLYAVVASALLFTHRIILTPAQKQGSGPLSEHQIARCVIHPVGAGFPRYIIVDRKHIHEHAGKVSLVVVMRLIAHRGAPSLARLGRAYACPSVGPVHASELGERIVALLAVCLRFRGIEMHYVFVCVVFGLSPP